MMKKASKPSGKPCRSAQEECGVWLDPVQLKGKVKQNQRVRRPISKLLNPSIGGGGYSVAVALNFTQTKSPMPNTKQSSISSFFAPQSRVLNKTASSEPANSSTTSSSSSSSSSPSTSMGFASTNHQGAPVEFGTKPEHEVDPEVQAFLNREEEHPPVRTEEEEHPVRVVDHRGEGAAHRHHRGGERVTENEAPPGSLSPNEEEDRHQTHSFGPDWEDHQYEDRELFEKNSSSSPPPADSEPGGAEQCFCQEAPGRRGHGCSQYSRRVLTAHNERIQDSGSQFSLTHQEQRPTTAQEEEGVSGTALLLESLQSEEGFRVCLAAGGEGRTSTQKERGAGGEGRTSTQKERGGGGEGRTSTQKERGGGGEGRTSTQKETRGGGEGRTSTQKPRLASQKDEEEKENDRSSSSSALMKSPNKRSSLSPPRRPPLGNRTFLQTTAWSAPPPPERPRKRAREDADDDARPASSSPYKRRPRPRGSPLKKTPPRPLQEEDSLAMLFTQDSEGFRVIAHRGQQRTLSARSPLKDHSNLSGGTEKRTASLKTFVEEEEEEDEEMLFTQDSQGNRVIKH